jgi:hypothetical protein
MPEHWPEPTLADGASYFDTLFENSPSMQRLLDHFGVASFKEVVQKRLSIPSHLFPAFPTSDADVAVVDFDRLVPPYPTGKELDELLKHCPAANREVVELLQTLRGDDANAETGDVCGVDASDGHAGGASNTEAGGAAGVDESDGHAGIHIDASDELVGHFNVNYICTSLTTHTDANCYNSGTDKCSRAHIIIIATICQGVQVDGEVPLRPLRRGGVDACWF